MHNDLCQNVCAQGGCWWRVGWLIYLKVAVFFVSSGRWQHLFMSTVDATVVCATDARYNSAPFAVAGGGGGGGAPGGRVDL
jgi:hypothetical protein